MSSSTHGEYEPLPASKVHAGSGAAVCFCPPMLSHPEERSGALILRLSPLLGGGLGEFSDERRWSWWRCVARFYYFSLTPPPLLFVWPLKLLVFGCRGKRAEG
ncbi:hypothetical protein CHARACLAT_009444 [Characodon lateralis]|uniref:Uncharacterized protein n=1 Tax=Characodon lateralis TaxID=208331 RepID=A0ABU7D798_9TELE|nr:hypothetical protein [Characodon lateralis]